MSEVTPDELRSRFAYMEDRRRHFEAKSQNAEGRLALHEVWRHNYVAFPYLIGAPDERIAARFRDIFVNQNELGSNVKIGMLPIDSDQGFMAKFTHMLEECGARYDGMPQASVIQDARKPLLRYFEDGDPIAVRIFEGYTVPSSPIVVKYGRLEFLEPMFREGRIRISPASYYNDASFGDAIRDDEVTRYFCIPTFRERLKGIHSMDFQGQLLTVGTCHRSLDCLDD